MSVSVGHFYENECAVNARIRSIQKEDEAALQSIIAAAYVEFGYSEEIQASNRIKTKNLFEQYQQTGSLYLVAEVGSDIVGGGGLQDFSHIMPGLCELKRLYLSPNARGLGLGRRLVEAILLFAKERYQGMYLETIQEMQSAIQLYSRLGFHFIERPDGYICPEGCNTFMALYFGEANQR